jgi:hypothetical protein
MSYPLRRRAVVLSLVAALLGPAMAAVSAPAGAATSSSIVPSILANTDRYLTSVRTYFLCSTATCKKHRGELLVGAQRAMSALTAQATTAAHARVATKYHATTGQFVADTRDLEASFREYFRTTSTVTLSGLVGNIFYLTSEVGSDVNVLRAVSTGSVVPFDLWVEGEAATLVAMQTDASALQSSTATKSIGIYANQLLEAEATSMIAHAHGPTASFNALLVTFARNQARISRSEILFLQGKRAPLNEKQVANLNVTVAAEFSTLVKTETALVKKKK